MLTPSSPTALLAAESGTTVAWFTLAGALGGVLLTGVLGVLTARMNHRWQDRRSERESAHEHQRQLRQERRQTYAHYWSAWNRFHHQIRALHGEVRAAGSPADARERFRRDDSHIVSATAAAEAAWRDAADALSLIGGEGVLDAVAAHIEVTERKLAAAWEGKWHPDEDGRAYRRLNDAMRRDLIEPA